MFREVINNEYTALWLFLLSTDFIDSASLTQEKASTAVSL